jgi:hypothetical protein
MRELAATPASHWVFCLPPHWPFNSGPQRVSSISMMGQDVKQTNEIDAIILARNVATLPTSHTSSQARSKKGWASPCGPLAAHVIQIEIYADWKSAVRKQLALPFDLIDAGR